MKQDIKSMNLQEMQAMFSELGEPAFRAKQVFVWLHKGVTFDGMTNLSKDLREKLKQNYVDQPVTVLEKKQSVLTQEARSNDKGYFYQICKNNGAEVAVTNWTFGNHTFTDLFEECSADRGCNGVDHSSYLTDRSFDYVVKGENV